MQPLPNGFSAARVDCGAVTLNVVTNAPDFEGGRIADERPAMVFLHGFPEYWAGWKPALADLARDHLLIVPDQRGYNLSDAPPEIEAYAARHLVSDILGLTERLLGRRRFLLAGHDWGASVAYALAIGAPERLGGLAIVNGVHPVAFQRALVDDPEQRAASQYIHYLRAPDAARKLAENGHGRMLSMFEKFSATPWLTQAEKADYVEAWSRPGRLDAMLNWYRASPLVVPKPGEANVDAPLASAPAEKFLVKVPHLLLWGARDQALRPSSTACLGEFAPDLKRIEIADGDHWVIHSHGGRIAREIGHFAKDIEFS